MSFEKVDVTEFTNAELQEAMSVASSQRISSFEDIAERVHHRIENPRSTSGFTLPWGKTVDLVRLREKELSLVAGLAGHRKTTLISQVLLWLSQQTKVGLASFEMDLEDVAKIMIWQAAASGSAPSKQFVNHFLDYTKGKIYGFDYRGTVAPLMALGIIRAMAEKGCKVICLDSLMMCGINNDLDAEREFVSALTGLARSLDVHVMLVHHALEKKNDGEAQIPQRQTIRGNGAIVDLCSTVFLVWLNKKKMEIMQKQENYPEPLEEKEAEYLETHCCQKLIVAKQRYHPFEGSINLWSHPSRQMLSHKGANSVALDFGK